MGVSKEAAGLPWKRETTMERGGCHPFATNGHLFRLGQLVWRQVRAARITARNNGIERILVRMVWTPYSV